MSDEDVRGGSGAEIPLRHDAVMIPCPVCQRPFTPAGKRLYCRDACAAAAYRRRRAARQPVVVPVHRPRRPITVYECQACDVRQLGQQRCDCCGAFMRRVGWGGPCPHCDEAVAVSDLLGEEVGTDGP